MTAYQTVQSSRTSSRLTRLDYSMTPANHIHSVTEKTVREACFIFFLFPMTISLSLSLQELTASY